MLSTDYRLRLESICEKISNGESVELSEMIWAEKLSKANTTAASFLRRARRQATNREMVEGSLDDFLNRMDLGDPDPTNHKNGFQSPDEIAEFFKRDDFDGERLRRD